MTEIMPQTEEQGSNNFRNPEYNEIPNPDLQISNNNAINNRSVSSSSTSSSSVSPRGGPLAADGQRPTGAPDHQQDQQQKGGAAAKQPEAEANCCGYTVKEIDEHLDALINRFAPPPHEFRNPILQLLNRRRISALVAGDYDNAEQQDKAIQVYYMVLQMEEAKMNEDNRIDILFGRWQQLKKEHQDITDKWDKKMNDFQQEEQQRYNELLTKQKEEQDQFHAQWSDPNFLRPYNKPSSRLLQMREQEKSMAVARMYQKAKDMKQVADRLQKEETAAAQQKIAHQMELEWSRIMERQEIDRKKFADHKEKQLVALEAEKQKELKPTMNAINQIKSKKGMLLTTKQSSMTITRSAQESIETQSPRTHQKYATFRSEKKKSKLEVQPVKNPQLLTGRKSNNKGKTQPLPQDHKQTNNDEQQKQQQEEAQPKEEEENKNNQEQQQNQDQNQSQEKIETGSAEPPAQSNEPIAQIMNTMVDSLTDPQNPEQQPTQASSETAKPEEAQNDSVAPPQGDINQQSNPTSPKQQSNPASPKPQPPQEANQ